jgi:hypothetical protein
VVERFGVPVLSVLEWTRIVSPIATSEQRFSIARDLKEALKARFEPEAWQRVAKPIFDRLRQRQRDALVALVMVQLKFARLEQLYEYFLIDPGMEPVVQTSRIRLAIASVQLFVQRCLLNLEAKVHPSAFINAKHWEWMKRYRVWEANRKIFLYPENWLEPEFRDDKTHLFSELEGELLQGDVSGDSVEDTFLSYLRKLDELARLDIVATHMETKADPGQNTLHVIGRTFSQPHKYFYRRYVHQMWTAWEPITADVSGNHIVPAIWRDRLYLFWVTFTENAKPNTGPANVDPNQTIEITPLEVGMEAQLHWSEYLNGEWSTRESSEINLPDSEKMKMNFSVDPKAIFVSVTKEILKDGKERGVFVNLEIFDISLPSFVKAFYLAGRNSVPEIVERVIVVQGVYIYPWRPAHGYFPQSVSATRYAGSALFNINFVQTITTSDGEVSDAFNGQATILRKGSTYTHVPCNNEIGYDFPTTNAYDETDLLEALLRHRLGLTPLMKPIFYQDKSHTFFIEPSVTERTIEKWEEWIVKSLESDVGPLHSDWLDDIVVIPETPKNHIPSMMASGSAFPVSPESVLQEKPSRDWLINPNTGLLFDSELIGRGGRAELQVVPRSKLGNAASEAGVLVMPVADAIMDNGSATDSKVALVETTRLGKSGLNGGMSGLHIVDSRGVKISMMKKFHAFGTASVDGVMSDEDGEEDGE